MKVSLRSGATAAVVVTAALAVAACSSTSSSSSATGSAASGNRPSSASSSNAPSVAFMIPGSLGDLGFFDSANAGLKKASALGVTTYKVVESGTNDTSAWLSNLQNLSGESQYKIIVTGSATVAGQLTQVAKQYTGQKYIMFDDAVDLPNVASITFRQNDGAFLAGVLAALASEDKADFPLSSGGKNVGIVGGENIPVIQDFVVGFEAGAKLVDPSIKVQTSYVGSFTDSQTGYNQAASMYANGADVVFAAAGGSGLGVLKAARDKNKYAIGVDSDQNNLYPKNVLASDLKNVGSALYALIQKYEAGSLDFGKTYVFGLQNNGVELTLNSSLVPAAVSDKVNGYAGQVASGKVTVPCVNPYCAAATS